MGEDDNFHPKPSHHNPKGFFENIRFREINDRLLASTGYRVKSWELPVPSVTVPTKALEKEMSDLIRLYEAHHDMWGFKDPRTCLTLLAWLKVLGDRNVETKVIVMAREHDDVGRSMQRCGHTDAANGRHIAAAYFDHAGAAIKKSGVPHEIVPFERLHKHTDKAAQALSSFLGRPITTGHWIEPELVHYGN